MGILQTSAVALLLIAVLYLASFWISTASLHTGGIEKLSAYECGYAAIGDSRFKFELMFYIVGLLYLIFDLEVIFVVPLAVILPGFDSFVIFLIANLFIVIITISFIYEYLIGALDLT